MTSCPQDGSLSICKTVKVGGASYVHMRGRVEKRDEHEVKGGKGYKVEAMGKDTPSIILNFEVKLRRLQEKGIPYATLNRYFRSALKDDQIGLFDLKESLTYGRGEPTKDYANAFTALSQIPSSIEIPWLYTVVDGMPDI